MEQLHVTYNKNIDEISRLLKFQSVLRDRPDFRRNLEILNKSGIVLLAACWESFIEDLALNAFDFLLSNAKSHKAFPPKVLTQASKIFWDSKDERGLWAIADDGWKGVLASHRDRILHEYLGNFNTPRPKQVDHLFESLVGLKSLSSHWHWKGMNSGKAKSKLEDLISLRGSIAHKVAASRSVTKAHFFNSGVFIVRLGIVSSNTIRSFIHARAGKSPWTPIQINFKN